MNIISCDMCEISIYNVYDSNLFHNRFCLIKKIVCFLQARTLRLLANLYLDYNAEENLQNAINAVSLANTVRISFGFHVPKARYIVIAQLSSDLPAYQTCKCNDTMVIVSE